MPKLPDRWDKYSNIGDVISGTRIVTFKVPLHEGLCRYCPDDKWFTPQTLMELTEDRGTPLGLIIDLTFTTRYYNPQVFMDQGIAHTKIFVPGKEVPSRKIVKEFCSVIDDFTSDPNNSDKLVGVHCTHGVNRTGHLVCRYMIDRLNIEPETAIKAYGDARGYPIERENYLADLRRISGGDEVNDDDEEEEEKEEEEKSCHDSLPDPARHSRDHHDDHSDSQHNHRNPHRRHADQAASHRSHRDTHSHHGDKNDWRGGAGRNRHWSNDQTGHNSGGGHRGRGGFGQNHGQWRGNDRRGRGGYGGQSHGYQDWNNYSGGYHGNDAYHHDNRSRGGHHIRGGYGQQNNRSWGSPAYGERQESWNSYNRPRNAESGRGGYGGQNGGWSLDNNSDYGHFGYSSHGNQSQGQTRDDRSQSSKDQKRKAPPL